MARSKKAKRASKKTIVRKKRALFAYPVVVFLILCAGAYLIAATLRATADNVIVTAKVPGPAVTSPAVITSPADGTHFSAIPIGVSGTCPANAAYVEIFRNDLMSGAAICSAGGFKLSVDLFPGQNVLTAHVFNITDDEGPVSTGVTVYYDVPQPPVSSTPQPSGSGRAGKPAIIPLTLKTAFIYKGYFIGQRVEWPLEISGGQAPYAVDVDWGDDSQKDLISREQAGQFKISHTYQKSGGYKGSYTIKVDLADYSGATAHMEFFVIVNAQQPAAPGNIYSKPPPILGSHLNWLWMVWPAYVLVLVMFVSYWLGEREELVMMRKKGLLRR